MHTEKYGVYGVRKVHAQLGREGVLGASGRRPVARCTTQRLMKDLSLRGISRAKGPRTTVPGSGPGTRPDLVERAFTAPAQDRLWVADITFCRTFAGWVYAAFVLDVFSRRVVGWQLSTSLRTDLALDALNMGLWTRARDGHDTSALVHHSDRGAQYLAIRYIERLAEAGAVASVGSKSDSYDTLAEAFNSLFKAELVRNRGPWKSIDNLEIEVAEYIDWFNHWRLHGEMGLIPPVEYEDLHRPPRPLSDLPSGTSMSPSNPALDTALSPRGGPPGSDHQSRPAILSTAPTTSPAAGQSTTGTRARSAATTSSFHGTLPASSKAWRWQNSAIATPSPGERTLLATTTTRPTGSSATSAAMRRTASSER